MIKSFKHKGLRDFYETGNTKGIQAIHEQKIKLILGALDAAKKIEVLNIPAFRLHKLKGEVGIFGFVNVADRISVMENMLKSDSRADFRAFFLELFLFIEKHIVELKKCIY